MAAEPTSLGQASDDCDASQGYKLAASTSTQRYRNGVGQQHQPRKRPK